MSTTLVVSFALVWSVMGPAFARANQVSGIVVDQRTGAPLPGVIVRAGAQQVLVESDANGRFALDLPPGSYELTFSIIGYALVRRPLALPPGGAVVFLRVELAEGAGPLEEHVDVVGAAPREGDAAAAGATIHGRDLEALRGVTLDDPIRAMHALPAATVTDDFHSEFAIRGLGFDHTGLVVDGVPTRYLMHSVHGVSDGGSIAMLNSDAIASVSMLPGSYPQQFGRHTGAELAIETRDGDRSRFHARGGLSGTSATILAEGPLKTSPGSWLVSVRRSYLDLLLNRIEDENSLAFAFSDVIGKLTVDAGAKNQVEVLAVAGRSRFEERADDLGLNDEARVSGHTWLGAVSWRHTPSASWTITNRVYTAGLSFLNTNPDGDVLDESRNNDAGWRGSTTIAPAKSWFVEAGGDAVHLGARHSVHRSLNDAPSLSSLGDYRHSSAAASAYARVSFSAIPRVTVSPGVRVDRWTATRTSSASPWATAEVTLTPATRLRAGAGTYRQFADLEQIYGVRGGGTSLRPESARHVDVSVIRTLPLRSSLQLSWFARDERDVLWPRGAEPRRDSDGGIVPGRDDAPWTNALSGRARGVEALLRRDAPDGLSGWIGYAFTRHRYTDVVTREEFASDFEQRHTLVLFGRYAVSNRTTVGAKFRYGSSYPRTGYIREQPPVAGAPSLFGGGVPLFFELSDERNTLRLPAYARLDLRADRTFTWSRRRVTAFAELANALNRQNLRNVPYGVDTRGRVLGGTGTLMPILPNAGLVVEF